MVGGIFGCHTCSENQCLCQLSPSDKQKTSALLISLVRDYTIKLAVVPRMKETRFVENYLKNVEKRVNSCITGRFSHMVRLNLVPTRSIARRSCTSLFIYSQKSKLFVSHVQGVNNRWNRLSENQSINRWQSMPINRLILIIDEQSMFQFLWLSRINSEV